MKRIYCLLAVACLLAACTPSQTPAPTPTSVFEVSEPALRGPTVPPSTPIPLPPTPIPDASPPEMAFFRGISTYDWTRRFVLLYPLDTWQRDGEWLRHQAFSDCALHPQAAGMGLGPDWTHTYDRVTMEGWNFERRTFTQEGQAVPAIISYGLTLDESFFLFQLSTRNLDQTAFDRCRADAEAVLATFTPLELLSSEFPAARAALDVYEPPHAPTQAAAALAVDIAEWLSQGNDPADLAVLLRTLPKLDTVQPEVSLVDLNGDDERDVVVQTHLLGLPVVACLAQENGRFIGLALPYSFDEPLPTMNSGVLVQELTGDERPETVITYTVQGGSGWTELVYAFRWGDANTHPLIFHASLLNWAGSSAWGLEPDPAHPGQQQFVLTYPHLYNDGFDHKMVNHPLGQQVWRWDTSAGRFTLTEKVVDLEQSGWGAESPITVGDRLQWLTNEGETAFRSGEYETALQWYDDVLALAASEGWSLAADQPDWAAYARFRRAETLVLQEYTDEASAEMQAVAADYTGDPLGELAAAFLTGYGDGSEPDATARGVAAMQAVDLYSHLYYERGGALRFPMEAGGILYPGAGLAAYLDAHPELLDDAETLLAGLREIGFAADDVWLKSVGDEVVISGEVLIALRFPEGHTAEGALVPWALARSSGRWQVVQSASVEDEPAWPHVGGFAPPALTRGRVTP